MDCRTFDCDRTCPRFEAKDVCRFTPFFQLLGVPIVTSHTTTIDVQIKDKDVAKEVVQKLGGTILGEGVHDLYGTNKERGLGFRLPGWEYTLVLRDDCKLAFDPYRGGNIKEFTGAYVLATARKAARQNGWSVVSETAAELVLRHPSGGKLKVLADGTCDAQGFVGKGCHVTEAIESALGTRSGRKLKPEYHQLNHGVRATQRR